MKTALLTLMTAMLSIALFSCSSTPNNPPANNNTDTNVVKFTATQQTQYVRDSVEIMGGMEMYMPMIDSITQTVAAFNASLSPYTGGVTYFKNTYNDATPPDSDIFYQASNNDLYQINAGLEAINNIPAIPAAIGTQINVGWVLESKLSSSAGTQWIAIDTTINTPGPIVKQMTIRDTAQMLADTTFTLGSKVYTNIKHAQHRLSATASLGSAASVYDVYVSPVLGCRVLYRVHVITYNVGGAPGTENGVQTLLTSHN